MAWTGTVPLTAGRVAARICVRGWLGVQAPGGYSVVQDAVGQGGDEGQAEPGGDEALRGPVAPPGRLAVGHYRGPLLASQKQ